MSRKPPNLLREIDIHIQEAQTPEQDASLSVYGETQCSKMVKVSQASRTLTCYVQVNSKITPPSDYL